MLGIWTGTTVLVIGAAIVLMVAGAFAVLQGILQYSDEQIRDLSIWLILLVGAGFWIVFITAIILLVLGVFYVGGHISETLDAKRYRRRSIPAKPPGIMRQWMKAKKQRYCPLITVED